LNPHFESVYIGRPFRLFLKSYLVSAITYPSVAFVQLDDVHGFTMLGLVLAGLNDSDLHDPGRLVALVGVPLNVGQHSGNPVL
jgi:hypothetical protein